MPSFPWQVQMPDIGNAILTGERIRSVREEREEKKRQRDLALEQDKQKRVLLAQTQQGVQAYLQDGNPDILARVNPEVLKRLQDYQASRATMERQGAEFEQKNAQRKIQTLGQVLPVVQKTPQAWPAARQFMVERGGFAEEELPQEYDPEQLKNVAVAAQAVSGNVPKPEVPIAEFKRAAASLKYGPGSPKGTYTDAWNDPGIDAALAKELEASRKKGTTNIVNQMPGREMPTKTTRNRLQNNLTESAEMLATARSAASEITPEMLTVPAKAGNVITDIISKVNPNWVPPDDAARLTKQSKLFGVYHMMALAYRKLITGVAGGEREMRDIMAQMPDPEEQSWPVFVGKLQAQEQKLKIRIRLAQKFLAKNEGIPLGELDYEKFLAEAAMTGDKGNSPEDVRLMYSKYKGEGKSSKQIADMMTFAGYFTTGEQAKNWIAAEEGGSSANPEDRSTWQTATLEDGSTAYFNPKTRKWE